MPRTLLALIILLLASAFAKGQERSLGFYIATALDNSPLLKDYPNQVRSATTDSLLVLASLKPQVNLTSQALVSPTNGNIGYEEVITNKGNYSALLGVRQSLLTDKSKTAQLQSIQLNKQSLSLNCTLSQTDLKKAITAQYITAFSDYRILLSLKKAIAMLAEQQNAMANLVQQGLFQEIDLMNLSVNLKAQHIALRQQFILFKTDLNTLNLLAGIVDTASVQLAPPILQPSLVPTLQQSPIWLQSRLDSLKNTNARALLGLAYRPKLDAFADAGFLSIAPLNIPHNFGASIGLSFALPIYDGNQRKLNNAKIDLAEASRSLQRDFYIRQFSQQSMLLNNLLQLTDQLIRDITAQLSAQNELIALYKLELENGLVRFSDFLLALNNLISAQNNLTLAESNRLQIINQLNFLK